MNKNIRCSILLLLLILSSCGIGGPAGRYISYVKGVYTILLKNPEDAAAAAAEVYEYVEKNMEDIEKALMEMKELSAGETEKVYVPVTDAVNALGEYIRTHTKEDYPLGNQEKLILAFQILVK